MADVIFNGSANRKSVGQASVELVFDNSMGRLTGPYASYQEIAVKRLVTRDGDSFYYLNGSRCRRRDITDIFLGTGAGARGYSIIGQDTISRLIEARPEEIRAYLEEAAGVSKYKERRRETLQRIGHTRENLVRVADIRDELAKQLLRLERQAKAAINYQALKQDERLCKAEIQALKWRTLTTEQALMQQELSQLTLHYESHRTNMTGFIKENACLRENLHHAQENFQQTQVSVYQLRTEIARLEESVQQQQREKQQLTLDHKQIETDLQTATRQLQQDIEALASSEQALILLQANVGRLQADFHTHGQSLEDKQLQKNTWDSQWQQLQTVLNQIQREISVEQVRLQHVEERYQQAQLRLEKIHNEQSNQMPDPLNTDVLLLQEEHPRLAKQQQNDAEHHQHAMQQAGALRQALNTVEQHIHQAQDTVQSLVTEHAALTAAQNMALSKIRNEMPSLSQWEHHHRLAEVISVPDKWMRAFELVLGESLQAIVLDSMDVLWPVLDSMDGCFAHFVNPAEKASNTATVSCSYPRLLDKMTGVIPCWVNALDAIFAAETLAEAITWVSTLTTQQSVVTADGYWLGSGWVKVGGFKNKEDTGVLARQQALVNLKAALDLAQDQLSALQRDRSQLFASLMEQEKTSDTLKQALLTSQEAVRVCEAEIQHKQHLLAQFVSRSNAVAEEKEDLQRAIEDLIAQKIQVERQLQLAMAASTQYQQQFEQLKAEKTHWDDTLAEARRLLELSRKAQHQAELQCNRESLNVQQLGENMKREQRHIDTLSERLVALASRMDALASPDQALNHSLHEKVMQHDQLDTELTQQRQLVDEWQTQLNKSELAVKQEEEQATGMHAKMQQVQLQVQALAVRAASISDALVELNTEVEKVLAQISADVTLQAREEALLQLENKITRLGAINLVAIEEYQTELARKQHLDAQYQDLISALATLDSAIAKMDKETELRLKDTFDQVNTAFQVLFPRLFGGGRARLELTCDNLLEAGVLVMAQPPGKRNSTIHLLSGGEKAMTAVALVFAIFQQNPSPFCMLDEVDAPLDDLNVRRFCDLVREMSQFVQFLFITHNKVTMELANHLIGVTMREPGISRVVAVDVVEALSL